MGSTAAITQAAAGGVSAYGQHQAGKSAESIAKLNAGLADLSASDAIARGETEAARLRVRRRRLLGAQRAAAAGQGIDVNDAAGSVGEIYADTEAATGADVASLRSNAIQEAFGFRMRAISERAGGRQARILGDARAAGTLLTAGATYAQDVDRRRRARDTGEG